MWQTKKMISGEKRWRPNEGIYFLYVALSFTREDAFPGQIERQNNNNNSHNSKQTKQESKAKTNKTHFERKRESVKEILPFQILIYECICINIY